MSKRAVLVRMVKETEFVVIADSQQEVNVILKSMSQADLDEWADGVHWGRDTLDILDHILSDPRPPSSKSLHQFLDRDREIKGAVIDGKLCPIEDYGGDADAEVQATETDALRPILGKQLSLF